MDTFLRRLHLFSALFKNELFRYAVRPDIYIAGFLFSAAVSLYYFISTRFFVFGLGTSSLQVFFTAIPYCAVLIVPCITATLWADGPQALEYSLPVSDWQLLLAKWFAASAVFALALVPGICVPVIVSFYGSVEPFQVFTGYTGVLLFGAAACAVGQYFSLLPFNRAAVFLSTALTLFLINCIHLLPDYTALPDLTARLCRFFSFAWHFDSAGKGVLDTRDIAFYCIACIFVLVFSFFRLDAAKRKRRLPAALKLTRFFAFLACVLGLMISQQSYFRADLTASRMFSINRMSRALLENLHEPLRITYYVSGSLKKHYPQIRDVYDFLYLFADTGRNISLAIADPDKEDLSDTLASLGIEAQQIRTADANRVEFVSVYSAVVMEYLDKAAVIPFVLAVPGLEFELSSRVKALAQISERKVNLICGGGADEGEYMIALQWLNQAGFSCSVLSAAEFAGQDFDLTGNIHVPLVLFGTSALTEEEAAAIERFAEAGGSLFCSTSPVKVDMYDSWAAGLTDKDAFLPVLDRWGFEFLPSLLLDVSNYRLRMGTGREDAPEYVYRNYPLWINVLPQYCTYHPVVSSIADQITCFWASPLVLNEGAVPLMFTTPAVRIQEADYSTGRQFLTDPFQLNDTGTGGYGQQILAGALEGGTRSYYSGGQGTDTRIVVVSGELLTADLTLNYTGSSGNLELLINALLWLSYEDDMLEVRNKLPPNNTLYKADEQYLAQTQSRVFWAVSAIPALWNCIFFILTALFRKKYRMRNGSL